MTKMQNSQNLVLEMRSRTQQGNGISELQEEHRIVRWHPAETAVIICDMWDDHTCKAAASRVAEMASTRVRCRHICLRPLCGRQHHRRLRSEEGRQSEGYAFGIGYRIPAHSRSRTSSDW